MTRFTSIAVLAASLAVAAPAAAESQQEIAARLNDEGKALMYQGKPAEAAAKFADAAARIPDAKYFFNLCTARYQEGKFGAALTACNAAEAHSPDAALLEKIQKVSQRIQDDAKEQGIEIQAVGGGSGPNEPVPGNDPSIDPGLDPASDPSGGPGAQPPGVPTYTSATGRPSMQQGLFTATKPDNSYTWTFGAELFGGGGGIGRDGAFGNAGFGIRLKGDYLLNRAARFGTQAFLQLTSFTKGEDQMNTDAASLAVMDLGMALYKHFCLGEALCLTPLAGVQLALMSPGDSDNSYGETVFNYTSLGARLEIGAHYAFGTRLEHVLGVGLGTNLYSRVISESMDADRSAISWGLDKGGMAAYLSVGYTYRFNTPLSRTPFITLE
jgi:tetratricopeptide (TPR) repeat protein